MIEYVVSAAPDYRYKKDFKNESPWDLYLLKFGYRAPEVDIDPVVRSLLNPLFNTYKVQDDIAAVYKEDMTIEEFKAKYPKDILREIIINSDRGLQILNSAAYYKQKDMIFHVITAAPELRYEKDYKLESPWDLYRLRFSEYAPAVEIDSEIKDLLDPQYK